MACSNSTRASCSITLPLAQDAISVGSTSLPSSRLTSFNDLIGLRLRGSRLSDHSLKLATINPNVRSPKDELRTLILFRVGGIALKREALNHTKMKRLCRKLDLPLWKAVGLLETLWHLTAKQAIRGDIGKLSNEDIAIGLDYRDDENLLVAALLDSGWLDADPKYRLLIHDWADHAEDAVHMKLARAKKIFASGDIPKTNRLPRWEREEANSFFQVDVETVRTDVETVRTDIENVTPPCVEPLPPPPPPPPPKPLPRPPPPPPKETVRTESAFVHTNGNGRRRQFPELSKTRAEIGKNFPDVKDAFVRRLYIAACEAAQQGGCDPTLVTDALLAITVKQCHKKYQESAGLYLDTVPSTIQTWAETEEK